MEIGPGRLQNRASRPLPSHLGSQNTPGSASRTPKPMEMAPERLPDMNPMGHSQPASRLLRALRRHSCSPKSRETARKSSPEAFPKPRTEGLPHTWLPRGQSCRLLRGPNLGNRCGNEPSHHPKKPGRTDGRTHARTHQIQISCDRGKARFARNNQLCNHEFSEARPRGGGNLWRLITRGHGVVCTGSFE